MLPVRPASDDDDWDGGDDDETQDATHIRICFSACC